MKLAWSGGHNTWEFDRVANAQAPPQTCLAGDFLAFTQFPKDRVVCTISDGVPGLIEQGMVLAYSFSFPGGRKAK